MTPPTDSRSASYLASLPGWKQEIARSIHRAVYNAALSMTDKEIEAVVKHALLRARKDLSS